MSFRLGWRQRGHWLRALLCWFIGLFFILADPEPYFDIRHKLRGLQNHDERIVLIHITYSDWTEIFKKKNVSTYDFSGTTADSYYWDPYAWQKILTLLLAHDPLAIGVSPYFGKNISKLEKEIINSKAFNDKRVIWSMQIDEEGRILPSHFATQSNTNKGLNEHRSDRDGIHRRFRPGKDKTPHFAIQIEKRMNANNESSFKSNHTIPIINFRGPSGTFDQILLKDFMQGHYPTNFFENKVVLIGTKDDGGYEYLTPLGRMSRIELIANIVDNIQNNRWIKNPGLVWINFILIFFVVLSAWVTSRYPQILALFLLFFTNLFYIAFSLWFFDYYYIWTPVLATVIVSAVTYITFLSFQLTIKEYSNIQLENEKKFLFEIEELKNNFLSLISHDLKTPIAKIQAICDRMMAQYTNHEFKSDILSLKEITSELHRYIKTILQITRVESRDFRITKDSIDINELIGAVVLQLDPLAKHKNIKLVLQLEPMFLIEADHVLIHEVILNLVENAIKYSIEGNSVKIKSQEVDDQVIVMVEDSGPGIPVEEQQKVFEKFYIGELGKSHSKGSGLGLYLVKYFIELHHGRIFLESNTKKGTKIGFSLPINEARIEEDIISGDTKNEK